ncbi:MAG: FAD-binding oxidoreductase [Rhizobiaceae bacterium]|nr:FAD-binding oxidoreductase [Rhizobiaceae bacterium]
MLASNYLPLQDDPGLPDSSYKERLIPLWDRTRLEGDRKADIAIIGGGLTGVSAALFAAEAGASVVLIEANEIGWGASGRNFGQMTPYLRRDPDKVISLLGQEAGDRLINAASGAPSLISDLISKHGIQCDLDVSGLLYAAHTPAALEKLKARARWWAGHGVPIQILDHSALKSAIGGGSYWGGILEPRGGTLNPLAYCRGLAAAAIQRGATIHEGDKVLKIERENDGWLLTTANGRLHARTTLVCTDSYSDGLLPELYRSLLTFRGYQLVSKPLAPDHWKTILPGGQALTDTHRMMSGIRKLPGCRIQVSASVEPSGPERYANRKPATSRVRALYPFLGDVEWESSWSGWIGLSVDELPRLVEPLPQLFVGYGYSGRGLSLSTIMGRELATKALIGGKYEAVFPGGRLRPIPMSSLARRAASAMLRVYQLADKFEDAFYGARVRRQSTH